MAEKAGIPGRIAAREFAAWAFGALLILFVISVFIFAPEHLPHYKHRQLGFLCALLAGLFAYFFIGSTEILIKSDNPVFRFAFRGGGGAVLFVLVLLWWGSPYSLVGIETAINDIREDTEKLVQEQETSKVRSLAWLSPDITDLRAFDYVKTVFGDEIDTYDLIEVLGSYYICLEPPARIFHRFPEWVFTFRHRRSRAIVQYQVYDARVPRPPSLRVEESKENDILYYAILKEEYDDIQLRHSLEAQRGRPLKGNAFSVWFYDPRNLAYQSVSGIAANDLITEARETDRFKVLARFQALGRSYETPPTTGKKIQHFSGSYEYRVERADIEPTRSLDQLEAFPRRAWKLDVHAALNIARASGATGLAPGQLNYPGLFRLCYKKEGLDGLYWHLPYLLGVQYFVVNATTGDIYDMRGPHQFTKHEPE